MHKIAHTMYIILINCNIFNSFTIILVENNLKKEKKNDKETPFFSVSKLNSFGFIMIFLFQDCV